MTQHQKKITAKNCQFDPTPNTEMKIHLKKYYQSDLLANTTFNTKTKTKNNRISLDQNNK